MRGKDFAATRASKGYTQAALAQALGTSPVAIHRLEAAAEVPAEKAQALLALPEAPGGRRGPYRRPKVAAGRGKAARRAVEAQPARGRHRARPLGPDTRPAPASAAAARLPVGPEELPVLEAEAAGAVLLEDFRAHSARVAQLLRVEDATRHARPALPQPRYPLGACVRCPWRRCPVPLVAPPTEGCCLWR